jgi:hypothetical protein
LYFEKRISITDEQTVRWHVRDDATVDSGASLKPVVSH